MLSAQHASAWLPEIASSVSDYTKRFRVELSVANWFKTGPWETPGRARKALKSNAYLRPVPRFTGIHGSSAGGSEPSICLTYQGVTLYHRPSWRVLFESSSSTDCVSSRGGSPSLVRHSIDPVNVCVAGGVST